MGKKATKADFIRLRDRCASRLGEGAGLEVFLAVVGNLEHSLSTLKPSVGVLKSRLDLIAHWSRQASVIVGELYTFGQGNNRLKHEKGLLLVRAKYRRLRGPSNLEKALSSLDLLKAVEQELASCDLPAMQRYVGQTFENWVWTGRMPYPSHPASPQPIPAQC